MILIPLASVFYCFAALLMFLIAARDWSRRQWHSGAYWAVVGLMFVACASFSWWRMP